MIFKKDRNFIKLFQNSEHKSVKKQNISCTIYSIWQCVNYVETEKLIYKYNKTKGNAISEVFSGPQLFSSSKFVDQSAKKYKCILKKHC